MREEEPENHQGGRVHTTAILVTAALLRLGVFWLVVAHFPHNWLFLKGRELGVLAQSLSTGHGYSSPFGGSTGPTAYLAPGYPALIALFFRVFGVCSYASEIAILLLQITFSVVTVALILYLARKLFGSSTANVAGFLWAVSPPLLWLPTIFWDTSLSMLFVIGFTAFAWRLGDGARSWEWVLFGLLAGGALLVNPSLLLLLLGLVGWAAVVGRRAAHSRYVPVWALVMIGVVLAPWAVRNEHKLHAFIPLRSNLGFELWNGNQPGGDGTFEESLHPVFNAREMQLYQRLGEVRYMREKQALAVQSIRTHRGEFLLVSTKRWMRFWSGMAQGSKEKTSGLIVAHVAFTSMAGLAGLLLLTRHSRELAALLALPLLLFPLPYYITHPDVRFRLLLDPLLIILAAHAVRQLWAVVSPDREGAGRVTERAGHKKLEIPAAAELL